MDSHFERHTERGHQLPSDYSTNFQDSEPFPCSFEFMLALNLFLKSKWRWFAVAKLSLKQKHLKNLELRACRDSESLSGLLHSETPPHTVSLWQSTLVFQLIPLYHLQWPAHSVELPWHICSLYHYLPPKVGGSWRDWPDGHSKTSNHCVLCENQLTSYQAGVCISHKITITKILEAPLAPVSKFRPQVKTRLLSISYKAGPRTNPFTSSFISDPSIFQ